MNRTGTLSRAVAAGGVLALLAIMMVQLAGTAGQNSITWDEDDHIYAGYMSWRHSDFGLNPEHPPLVKLVAALPLLPMPLRVPALQGRFFKHEAFLGGKDFLFKNDADAMLFRARMAAAVFPLLAALLVFLAAGEMFGTGAGFIALGLLVFDPNLLAHGAVVATDMGLSCFMFAATYAFYRYVKAPSAARLAGVGLAAGLALAAKHTAILVFPMLLGLALYELLRRQRPAEQPDLQSLPRKARSLQLAGALLVVSAISLAILWGFYGFRYRARSSGLALNPPLAEFVEGLSRPGEVRLLTTVAKWQLLPESYIYGLADVRIMSDFYSSFLLGKVYPHGVWFYFPVAFAIKSTLSFLTLLGVAVGAIAVGRLRQGREIVFLTVPPALHLAVAMGSGMNIGVRHILPMYLFLSVLVAGAAWKLIAFDRRWAYAVGALLLFQAVSSARTFPAYLAYANELWGGPANTYKLLSDSNTDWGQQLKATHRYLEQRGLKECWFAFFAEGAVDTGYYGIPCKPLPTAASFWFQEEMDVPGAVDGTVLISAAVFSGFEFGAGALNPYQSFKSLRPTAVIDYGVLVFDGHFQLPLAAALSHAHKSQRRLAEKRLPEAGDEARKAVALASDAVKPNLVLGDVLAAMGQVEQARPYYRKALGLASTVEPEFQGGWIKGLRKKLATED